MVSDYLVRSLLACAVLAMCSCGSSHVKRGAALYAEGRFIEAADIFEKTEYMLEDSDSKQRAEYAAYRGLTMLGLGDLRHAQQWMAYAYQVEKIHPGSLRPEERDKLDSGWSELGNRLQRAPAPPSTPGTALAASQPPPPPAPPSDTPTRKPPDPAP